MRASCFVLILALLLSSTLAKPMVNDDLDGQKRVLQYLLHQNGNGIHIAIK